MPIFGSAEDASSDAEKPCPITVMIPLGGIGSRFQKEGYEPPKPFVNVLGEPMLLKVVHSLKLDEGDELVVVYNPAFIANEHWDRLIKHPRWPPNLELRLVKLPGATRGAAETVLIGLKGLPDRLRARPVLLADGDTFYDADIVGRYRAIAREGKNGVFFFRDTQPKPLYSYVTTDADGKILEVKEKVKISHKANTGCYCFASGKELRKECEALLAAQKTQLSQDAVGEYYTSGVIANMLAQDKPFYALEVPPAAMHVTGTPAQLVAYCRAHQHAGAARAWFEAQYLVGAVTYDKVQGCFVPSPSWGVAAACGVQGR